MSRCPPSLLNEVLAEEAPSTRSELDIEAILATVRGRRRTRQAKRVVTLIAMLALAMSPWVARWFRRPARPAGDGSEPALTLVASVPLDRDQVIETQSGQFALVTTTREAVTLLATAAFAEPVPEIDDQQLLLLAASHTPALVRRGPRDVVLLLLDGNESVAAP